MIEQIIRLHKCSKHQKEGLFHLGYGYVSYYMTAYSTRHNLFIQECGRDIGKTEISALYVNWECIIMKRCVEMEREASISSSCLPMIENQRTVESCNRVQTGH